MEFSTHILKDWLAKIEAVAAKSDESMADSISQLKFNIWTLLTLEDINDDVQQELKTTGFVGDRLNDMMGEIRKQVVRFERKYKITL